MASVNQPMVRGRGTAASRSRATAGAGPRRATRTRSSGAADPPHGVCSSATSVLVVSSSPATDAPFCERGADDAQRVDDAHRDHVPVAPGQRVEPVVRRRAPPTARPRPRPGSPALAAISVAGSRQRPPHDLDADRVVPGHVRVAGRRRHPAQPIACSSAAPPPATMPSAIAARVADSASSTRCRSSLSSAGGRRADPDDRDLPDSAPIRSVSTSSSMPNVARSSSARSCAEPELDRLGRPAAADDRGVVRGDPDLPGPAELLDGHRLQGEPGVPAVHRAAGQRGDVLELVQPPVAEPGRADRHALEDPVDVVVHQHGQRGALDVLRDDHQRPRRPASPCRAAA